MRKQTTMVSFGFSGAVALLASLSVVNAFAPAQFGLVRKVRGLRSALISIGQLCDHGATFCMRGLNS